MAHQHLGRGTGKVDVYETIVIKTTDHTYEPGLMRAFPEVFVPVIGEQSLEAGNTRLVRFTMPRLHIPAYRRNCENRLLLGLPVLRRLWDVEVRPPEVDWRDLLGRHLRAQRLKFDLGISEEFVEQLVRRLPEPKRWGVIHGDPTLANLGYDMQSARWRWFDPLVRAYIPPDPHVDLGKMFQSCCGYERRLSRTHHSPDVRKALARELAGRAALDEYTGWLWCVVHLVRLLPYQTDASDRSFFEERTWSLWSSLISTGLSSTPSLPS